ncbi:MAG: MBL fold metallo-hydrolase [Cellulosilyticaceae bacterium]
MIVHSMALGMVQTNTYFIIDEATKKTVIIDPADEAERILSYIKENDLKIAEILLTHGHFDHIGAATEVAEKTGAEITIHEEGKTYLSNPNYNLSQMFMGKAFTVDADVYVKHKQKIEIEGTDLEFEVLHVPGHTLDGVAYYMPKQKVVFVGDILFKGSIGRTDFPGGEHMTLINNIHKHLLPLPEETVVYSGHGEATTIGEEKNKNTMI